jgi:hypothetical protein
MARFSSARIDSFEQVSEKLIELPTEFSESFSEPSGIHREADPHVSRGEASAERGSSNAVVRRFQHTGPSTIGGIRQMASPDVRARPAPAM